MSIHSLGAGSFHSVENVALFIIFYREKFNEEASELRVHLQHLDLKLKGFKEKLNVGITINLIYSNSLWSRNRECGNDSDLCASPDDQYDSKE